MALQRLPLPLGEGWGEGNEPHVTVGRATIWESSRILRQFPDTGAHQCRGGARQVGDYVRGRPWRQAV